MNKIKSLYFFLFKTTECQNCIWWVDYDADDEKNTLGQCRRHPPTVNAGTWGSSTDWPEVDAFDYCGEHDPM